MEERKTSKRASVTHNCERDLPVTAPQSRTASSSGVGRRLLAARGITTYHSHVTLAHGHACTLTWFVFFRAVFEEKRGISQSTLRTIIKLC